MNHAKISVVLVLILAGSPPAAEAQVRNYYSEVLGQAVSARNPRMCDDLTRQCADGSCGRIVNDCYAQYARDAKDPRGCGYLTEPIDRNRCYQIYAHEHLDINACEYLKTSAGTKRGEYAQCLLSVQHEAADYSLQNCLKIRDYDGGMLFNECVGRLAQQTKDASLCATYQSAFQSSPGAYQKCVEMAAPSYPPLVKSPIRETKEVTAKAVETSNLAACEETPCKQGENCSVWRDECYREYALKRKDIAGCRKIQNPANKSVCYRMYASIFNDKSVCDDLKGQVNSVGASYYDFCVNRETR